MNIGLIGAGNIGATAARLFLDAGHAVALSNSRGPDTLQALVDDLGDGAQALPVEEAAAFGDLVLEAIPYGHVDALPGDALADTILVSASNYFAQRDGEVDFEGRSHTGRVAALHPGARVVKAFNTIYWEDLRDQADASLPIEERRVIPLAGDDAPAKETVSALIEEIGFAALDVGGLEAGGRLMQPGQPLYNEALTRPEARRRIQQAGAEG
jgi:predicted dinucleotide-binding enzyme